MDKLPKFALRCTPTEKRKRGSQKPPGGEQRWKSWRRWDLLGAKRRPKGEAQAKAKDRVEWRRLISTLRPTRDGEIECVSSGGSRGGVGGPPPLFSEQSEARRAEKCFFSDRVFPLISRSGWTPPFLIWRSGSATGEWVSKPLPNGDRLKQVRL